MIEMTPSNVKARLWFFDGSASVELPIYTGTVGPDVIDIRKLYGQTGKFTYDPVSCRRLRAIRRSPDLSYSGNFLRMLFATPCAPYTVNPMLERALDR